MPTNRPTNQASNEPTERPANQSNTESTAQLPSIHDMKQANDDEIANLSRYQLTTTMRPPVMLTALGYAQPTSEIPASLPLSSPEYMFRERERQRTVMIKDLKNWETALRANSIRDLYVYPRKSQSFSVHRSRSSMACVSRFYMYSFKLSPTLTNNFQ